MPYYVVGGRYRDTTFRELVEPDEPEGPFHDYSEALVRWRGKSMARIDEAYARYLIVRAEDARALGRAIREVDAVLDQKPEQSHREKG